jgi:hypothetical protein
VALDLTATTPGMAVELPAGSVERRPHGDKNIVMHLEFAGVAANGDDLAGHVELDAEMGDPPRPLGPMPTLDDNPAGGHPIENALQIVGTIANPFLHRS